MKRFNKNAPYFTVYYCDLVGKERADCFAFSLIGGLGTRLK